MGDIMKAAREARGITQAELAGILGISQRAVAYYEKGERRPPVPMGKRIGEALGIDWTKIYDDGEDAQNDVLGKPE